MKITAIELKNIRGFRDLSKTEFSDSINVFIGSNNSGKSIILNSIYLVQKPGLFSVKDKTVGSVSGVIKLFCSGEHLPTFNIDKNRLGFVFNLQDGGRHIMYPGGGESSWGSATPNTEPDNLIYPFLSKRKVVSYSEEVHKGATNSVNGDFTHLYSKVDRLSDPEDPRYEAYTGACDNILGFRVSASAGDHNGKRAVYKIKDFDEIPLINMGEGVANILGLIVDLCVAENKIFLIEELENDIHPKALKGLLNLIISKSTSNQFFVSTHSNIVMKVLGAEYAAKVFEVTNTKSDPEKPKLFLSSMQEICEPEDRHRVLEDLGYEFFDFEQYEGYLFLEESSAERIIKEYLVRWFTPSLISKLKTFSARSINEVELKFKNFNDLFVFVHLQKQVYKNKAWVVVDGGLEKEKEVIEKLRSTYVDNNGWDSNNFSQWSEHDFEMYYPESFKQRFLTDIKSLRDKKEKFNKKKELLDELILWANSNEEAAKKEFEVSAKEVIEKLKAIESSMSS